MSRYGSLNIINPSGFGGVAFTSTTKKGGKITMEH